MQREILIERTSRQIQLVRVKFTAEFGEKKIRKYFTPVNERFKGLRYLESRVHLISKFIRYPQTQCYKPADY